MDDFEHRMRTADADLERAIELDPACAKYYAARSFLKEERGDKDGARRDKAQALEMGYPEAWILSLAEIVKKRRIERNEAP